jgi:WD repeat-containing protein 35
MLHRTPHATTRTAIRKRDKECAFHIDEITYVGAGESGASLEQLKTRPPSADPLTALVASDSTLLVTRQSGEVLRFSSPNFTLEHKFTGPLNPMRIELNSTSTQLAHLDMDNVLRLVDLEAGRVFEGLERKDVWEFRWASDNPEMLAVMEKTKLLLFHRREMEEPILASGYICSFADMSIRTVQLDEVLKRGEAPRREFLQQHETATSVRLRVTLELAGLERAFAEAEALNLPCLWKLIAEKALDQSNYPMAQKAFVRAADYQGLQFLKRLQKIPDLKKQQAEVAVFFSKFDVAERLYLGMDRKDLAIDLRMRLGDWFRVIQLAKGGGGMADQGLERVWNAIGDHFYQRQDWVQALSSYEHAKNVGKMITCNYVLDRFTSLERIASTLPDNSAELRDVASKFITVGLCEQAVDALVRCSDVPGAIDVCIRLNQWSTAVDLAQRHNVRDLEGLLHQYAVHLLSTGKRMDAVELYRKAGMFAKSAKILFEEAVRYQASGQGAKHPVLMKKIFVLAALEVEQSSRESKVCGGVRAAWDLGEASAWE